MMAAEYDVQSEIEVLQSIYLDELQVDRREDGTWDISLVLYPSTAEDSVSQFVRLSLTLSLDHQYPCSSPAVSIRNPRGLSEDKLSSVQKCLQLEAQSWLGSPVLYQLIEKAKEILTESNIPHENCVICLYGFKEGEAFTKTSCYHYFHSHCLGRYASHAERELRVREKELEEDKTRDRTLQQDLTVACPVCREPLTYDLRQLLSAPAPQLPQLDEASVSSDFQQKWRELQKLLDKQRAKGGLIDPEEESARFLIHIQQSSPDTENENPEIDVSPGSSSSNEAGVNAERSNPGRSQRGGVMGQVQGRGLRGGRSRTHQGRAAPVTERLESLYVSSDHTEEPVKTKSQDQPVQQNPDWFRARAGTDICAEQQERWVSPNHRAKLDLETDGTTSTGDHGHHGRRRGPRRPIPHAGAPRPSHHRWDGRGSRSRGGPSNPRGPRRGHQDRGFQQKVVEHGRGEMV
ncbi:E3 ubiquitin-protein ligase RNF25 [Nematolebias whitei]|uniref:E3 ubiquitin-protein ligase RNF25 n=1 Tax=Nematolebias whitei TaxID=451745 RepID=UPI001899A45F|nr:E3 ubiquitin-protein ligase RNF25 [Nematolebias whitei]